MKFIIFAKRNTKEMLRDPIIYIFCLGFPVAMLLMFQIINYFTAEKPAVFLPKSLVPGIMVFSFTFVMLLMSLLVSKDRSTAFLKRLYTSPLKPSDFVLGYGIPCFFIGIIQAAICVAFGAIISLIFGQPYFSFEKSILLIISQIPMLLFCIFLGITFGSLLNDKSAPGITSVFIAASGILGGAWMPLETMGKFETFCRFLPFYPSVYLGRIITGAKLSIPSQSFATTTTYTFGKTAKIGILTLIVYLIFIVLLSFITFKKQMKSEK